MNIEYDRIDVSGGIDFNKSNGLPECIIFHYSSFVKINFRFQPKLCDGCHDLLQRAMSFNDVGIVSDKGIDYRVHFWYISKDEAINLLKNADLTDLKFILLYKIL